MTDAQSPVELLRARLVKIQRDCCDPEDYTHALCDYLATVIPRWREGDEELPSAPALSTPQTTPVSAVPMTRETLEIGRERISPTPIIDDLQPEPVQTETKCTTCGGAQRIRVFGTLRHYDCPDCEGKAQPQGGGQLRAELDAARKELDQARMVARDESQRTFVLAQHRDAARERARKLGEEVRANEADLGAVRTERDAAREELSAARQDAIRRSRSLAEVIEVRDELRTGLDSLRARWHELERIQDRQLTGDQLAIELVEERQRAEKAESELTRAHAAHAEQLDEEAKLREALKKARAVAGAALAWWRSAESRDELRELRRALEAYDAT